MQISGLPVSTAFGAADVLAIEINGITYKITGATLAAALQSMGDYVTAQDIVNNLTTTDEGYVLDARQGKALLDAIEALDADDIGAVAVSQGAANAGKALVVDENGNVALGEAGVPEAVATALLACFRKVAWVDDSGQTLYNALAEALDGQPIDPTLLYDLAVPTSFDGTSHIDTGVKLATESVLTIMCEFTPSSIDSISGGITPITYVYSNKSVSGGNAYNALQLADAYSNTLRKYVKTMWGCGVGWSATEKIGANETVRWIAVFDSRAASNPSGKYTSRAYYNNITREAQGNGERSDDLTTFNTDDTFWIGATRETGDANRKLKGTVSKFRIIGREMTQSEMTAFLQNGVFES